MSQDKDAEELLQESKEQSRHTSEPSPSDATAATPDRKTAIKEALLAIEADEYPENINIRDARLKALLIGLETTGDLEAVARDLAATLDADTETEFENTTQSDVARLLIRVGLQTAAPEVLEDAMEAREQAVLEQTSGF